MTATNAKNDQIKSVTQSENQKTRSSVRLHAWDFFGFLFKTFINYKYVSAFKDPLAALVRHLVPPPQAHQQPPTHIFDRPEVARQQEDGDDKNEDEIGGEEGGEQVEDERHGFEQHVENHDSGVTVQQ